MGLTGSELLGALATEGAFKLTERRMGDMEKWMGVFRHGLGTVGMALAVLGYVDDAQWQTVVGGIMAILPFILSWKAKA